MVLGNIAPFNGHGVKNFFGDGYSGLCRQKFKVSFSSFLRVCDNISLIRQFLMFGSYMLSRMLVSGMRKTV